MRGLRWGDWFAVFFTLATVYVLVRPKSQAAQFVAAVGKFLGSLVRTATDTAK